MNDLEQEVEDQETENLDDLAQHVMDCFRRAKRHRDSIGMTETVKDCLRRYRGKYTEAEKAKFDGIEIFRGLTGMLVRSAYSWLKDAYFNAQDKPWTLDPTPNPELPETLKIDLNLAIERQLAKVIAQDGMSSSGQLDRKLIDKLYNTASKLAYAYSEESVKGMSRVIEDQLLECEFRDILHELILDVCIYPYAVIKGPVIRNKVIPKWEGDKYTFKKEQRYYIDRIDPANFYPSPDSKNTQDGEFIVEIIPMSKARLNEAKGMKGFSKEAINLVFSEAQYRIDRQAELMADDSDFTHLDGVGRSTEALQGSMFDVYEYHGRISGSVLLTYADLEDEADEAMENGDDGVKTENWGTIHPFEDYECVIWVCNGVTIMSRLNKTPPVPHRPYFVTSCFKLPHSIYGESIPMIIADLQDELNIAARSRMYNTGMSAGPIVEVDKSRFPDNDHPESISPWSVYPVATDTSRNNNSAPAVRFNTIPNVGNSLTAIMEETWEKAHRISGIPPYMYGDNRGSAQTLGAFSLQYAGATKGIKTIISNIDTDIVEKLIQQFYYYNMVYHDDDAIKSDARINVRGSAGLIAQEQRQARPLELLQALGPLLDSDSARALANKTLLESGYDPATLGAANSNAAQEAQSRLVDVNQPMPDGRSGDVSQQIQESSVPIDPSTLR